MLDPNQIIQQVFDSTGPRLSVTVVGVSATQGTQLDAAQVWKKIYDPATNTIRVAAV